MSKRTDLFEKLDKAVATHRLQEAEKRQEAFENAMVAHNLRIQEFNSARSNLIADPSEIRVGTLILRDLDCNYGDDGHQLSEGVKGGTVLRTQWATGLVKGWVAIGVGRKGHQILIVPNASPFDLVDLPWSAIEVTKVIDKKHEFREPTRTILGKLVFDMETTQAIWAAALKQPSISGYDWKPE